MLLILVSATLTFRKGQIQDFMKREWGGGGWWSIGMTPSVGSVESGYFENVDCEIRNLDFLSGVIVGCCTPPPPPC